MAPHQGDIRCCEKNGVPPDKISFSCKNILIKENYVGGGNKEVPVGKY